MTAATQNKLAVHLIAEENLTPPVEHIESEDPGAKVFMFDYNIENHLRTMDTIDRLCQVPMNNDIGKSEMEQLSSMITFLRRWQDFTYKPRILRFDDETGSSLGKFGVDHIHLPQFSAATVPKDKLSSNDTPSGLSNDFVFYVGGPVWALDWCPRAQERSNSHVQSEFIAVGVHPPDSPYHRLGDPVTGRGVIQIWCVLNVIENKGYAIPTRTSLVANKSTLPKIERRGRPRKTPIKESPDNFDCNKKSPKTCPRGRPKKTPFKESPDNFDCNNKLPMKGPRGRSRKNPIKESPNKLDCIDEVEPVPVLNAEDVPRDSTVDGVVRNTRGSDTPKVNGKKRKTLIRGISACNSSHSKSVDGKGKRRKSDSVTSQINNSSESDLSTLNCILPTNESLDNGLASNLIPEAVASPRMVLCLAHNGKVAWDAKWRPTRVDDIKCPYRMGYLAVILGNGSLEVWDVPLPSTVSVIFSNSPMEGTDPRFVKLNPVFQYSKLMCGEMQSIPLTVEWSSSSPHDFILAGCHDGTVALWKFSVSDLCKDTKPLLCFSADTAPIRALAWAPVENDPESANVIVTAGHGGLKFWDLRDPFRPIWDLSTLPKVIYYSLDWLPEPRCLILSVDDGTLKILNLNEASYDVPVTGKPSNGSRTGLHTYQCSSFPIWSIHSSHSTGMVAYCTSDGNVHRFQLSINAVEKDPSRNRPPTFLCTSVAEESSIVTIRTPVADTPLLMKKQNNGLGATAASMREFMLKSKNGRMNNSNVKGQSQTLDYQTPALCYGDDLEAKAPGRKSDKRTLQYMPMIYQDSERANAEKQNDDMPSKIVAMHRVRWNTNKGSERWLCYGGAAGIVRCQQIDFS